MTGELRAGQQAQAATERPMTSPVNWALLGLLIRGEDYGYRLAQRLERLYGDVLILRSESHIYTALDGLSRRGLIEEVSREPGTRRQPKVRYRARPQALAAYREWVLEQGVRQSPLFARALSMLIGAPDVALEILEHYERDCLRRIRQPEQHGSGGAQAGAAERIVAEDQRLSMEGRLPWIEFARHELEQLLGGGR